MRGVQGAQGEQVRQCKQGRGPWRGAERLARRQLTRGFYPFVASLADGWEVTSMEFLDESHPIYALRPASPLEVTWGFYSADAAFCYPGGEGPVPA